MADTGLIRRHRAADGLIFCDACEQMRPDVEYMDLEYQVGSGGLYGGKLDDNPIACRRCRTQGPPKLDPLSALTITEVKAIEALLGGHTIRDAARISGMPETRLKEKLAGRDSKRFRIAWQRMLEAAGLTAPVLARKAAELLESKDHKWNPKLEVFDEFPDNRTQLATVKFATTQLGGDPPKEAAVPPGAGGGNVFILHTNLGENATGDATDADYILEADGRAAIEDAEIVE